jgi:hypothetical protein
MKDYLVLLREKTRLEGTDKTDKSKNVRLGGTDKTDKSTLVSFVSPGLAQKQTEIATNDPALDPVIEAVPSEREEAVTSWQWLVHFTDRNPLEVSCSPVATHAEILEDYPDAVAAEPIVYSTQPSSPALTTAEESAIKGWLAHIEETDPALIAETIDLCQQDADARQYFTRRAAELPKPDPFPDDRRTCDQCANLIAWQCQAAKRGEIVASRNDEPIRDLPRRCEGYAPGAADADRRPGWERWPGLIQKKGE